MATRRTATIRSMIGAALSLCLVASGAPGAGASDGAAKHQPAREPAATPAAPSSGWQAVARARETGRPVRIDTLTDATTEIFANPDGTFTANLSAGPVRVPDEGSPSGWTPIDTTLVHSGDVIRPAAAIAKVTFSAGGSGDAARLRLPGGAMSMPWETPLPAPTLEGDSATYADVMPGVDLLLRATPTGFEQSFVLEAPATEPLSLLVPFDLERVRASISLRGNLQVTRADGRILAQADPPLMWDASIDPRSGTSERRAKVDTRIVHTSTGRALELTPDPGFLADPDLEYPVTVDPTTNLQVSKDTYVEALYPTQTYSGDNVLKVGAISSGGSTQKARSFIKFNVGPVSGTSVSSATINLYENYSYSCTGKKVNVYNVTSDWSGPTWNNQPTYGAIYASKTFAYGYSSACPAQWVGMSSGGANGKTLTTLVQGWANGSIANNGLALRATSETDLASWKVFNSSDHANNQPYLSVTYNSYPSTPTGLSPTTGTYQTTTTPTLHGKFCDPDGGKGRVNFEVRTNTSKATLVASSSTTRAKVSSCTDHPWTVPSGTLTNGTTYKWRAQASDGTLSSAWTNYRTFTIDTAGPSTPAISSSTHPNQTTWYPATNDDFTATWTASTDSTSGVAGYARVFDEVPNTVPTGSTVAGTTFTKNDITPSGIWYLHVRPKDNAGNWGTTAHYTVRLGDAAVTSPASGSESTEGFTLDGSADPAQGTARFQYRLSPTDAGGWRDIPPADVGLSAWPVPIDTSGNISALTWDASATFGAIATPVQIRLRGGLGATSSAVDVAFEPNDSDSRASAGPGSVDLVTGNFTLLAADAAEFGLGVFRTFDSRTPAAPASGIFGPGWSSGLESYSMYISLEADTTAGTISIETPDGPAIVYMQNADGTFETPARVEGESDEPAPTLTFDGTSYTLTEHDGTITVFEQQSGSGPFVPTRIETSASNSGIQSIYQVVGGVTRPTKIIDALPAGVSGCATTPVAGCRLLTFTYASSTTATGTSEAAWGDYTDRVKTIAFTGFDPETNGIRTVDVASYLYDSTGRLRAEWDPRISPALKTRYSYDVSGRISTLIPPGLNTWTMSYGAIAGDANGGRLLSVSRPGVPSGTATTTLAYGVPVAGTGAPHQMGATDVATWGQTTPPVTATAIFPPGHAPTGSPPASFEWASIRYLDANGHVTNVAASNGATGGHISTAEYGPWGNVVRSLTPSNRARVLAGVPDSSALWTANTYSPDGIELLETFGPAHTVQLANGTITQARAHMTYSYDEGAPASANCPCFLPTTATVGARAVGSTTDVDVRTTKIEYDWDLLTPTGEIVDPSGLNLKSTAVIDAGTGNVVETRMPANPAGGDAHATKFVYYGTTGSDNDCHGQSFAKWADLLCKQQPVAQPISGNELPVAVYRYDLWGDMTTKTETVTVPSAVRTTTVAYDAAGRQVTESVSGPGAPVPDATYVYDAATGLPKTASAGSRVIASTYDTLGRITSYADADGNTATYAYDLRDRLSSMSDGKGTYTLTYDQGTERRGMLTSLSDSQAGAFAASYDADGALSTQTWPNSMIVTSSFDETGVPTALAFTKTSNCTADCDWYVDQATPSIHGQWLARTSSLSEQVYVYDAAARVTRVDDSPSTPGVGLPQCTRRSYAYDRDSNRTSLTTWLPDALTGACNSTGTGDVANSTYDEADRATQPGYTFDAFARLTQVPATANGGQQVALSFFENDLVSTLTGGGGTDSISIDPADRVRQLTTPSTVETWHYAADNDSPAWVSENASGSLWTRQVFGPAGMLAATANQAGVVTLRIVNLHGDVVGTMSSDPAATAPTTLADDTEFGVPRSSAGAGWLGGFARRVDPSTGVVLMGARAYLPHTGRFAQTDPILGGSANAYDYGNQDPVNQLDPLGLATCRNVTVEAPDFPAEPFWFTMRTTLCYGRGQVRRLHVYSTAHGEWQFPPTWSWNGYWHPGYKNLDLQNGAGIVVRFPEWKAFFLHSSWCTFLYARGDGSWVGGSDKNPNGICDVFN